MRTAPLDRQIAIVTQSRPFSNLTLWILALVLAFPAQVLVLTIAQLGNDPKGISPLQGLGAFVCTNFIHGSTPFRCNFGRLVRNAVDGALIMDFFSVGLTLVLAVLGVALLLMGVRMVRGPVR